MKFIKLIVTNSHIVFQRLLFLMLCILFSLPCLAQNENAQTKEIPNLIQSIDTTTPQVLSLPDHLLNEKGGCCIEYDKQVLSSTDKALCRIIQPEEQIEKMTDIADSITACIQNCTEKIENYFKDKKQEIKQLWNTHHTIMRFRMCWIRSAGGYISISNHLLRLKKSSATLPKLKPELQCICRSFPLFINTCQRTVPMQHFIPPNHLII